MCPFSYLRYHKDVARSRHKLVPVIIGILFARKPILKGFLLIYPFPPLEVAQEHVSSRLYLENMKYFQLMLDVSLKTKPLTFILDKYRVTCWRCGLDRVRLILQNESQFHLEPRDLSGFRPG